jgi:putative tryptophan/tyrosine transport system substrate-binding protein
VNRRAFIWALASAWPLAARAQQSERVRRVGLLQGLAEDDPEWQRRFVAFSLGVEEDIRTDDQPACPTSPASPH